MIENGNILLFPKPIHGVRSYPVLRYHRFYDDAPEPKYFINVQCWLQLFVNYDWYNLLFFQHFIHGEMCDKRENHISYLVARLPVECSQRHSILHGDKCLSCGLTTYTGPDFYNHRAPGCGLGIGTSYFPVRWYLRMANGSKEALNLLTTIHQSHIPKSLQRA